MGVLFGEMRERVGFWDWFEEAGGEHNRKPGQETANMRPVRYVGLDANPAYFLQHIH